MQSFTLAYQWQAEIKEKFNKKTKNKLMNGCRESIDVLAIADIYFTMNKAIARSIKKKKKSKQQPIFKPLIVSNPKTINYQNRVDMNYSTRA